MPRSHLVLCKLYEVYVRDRTEVTSGKAARAILLDGSRNMPITALVSVSSPRGLNK